MYAYMLICLYVFMYICIYVYMYIFIYVNMYICIYVNMYICNGWMTYVDTTPITLIYDAMTSRLRIPCHHCDHQNPRV